MKSNRWSNRRSNRLIVSSSNRLMPLNLQVSVLLLYQIRDQRVMRTDMLQIRDRESGEKKGVRKKKGRDRGGERISSNGNIAVILAVMLHES